MPDNSSERICIIGFGRMGRRAAQIFSHGFKVTVVSSREVRKEAEALGATLADNTTKAISEADFVFLAVPVDVIGLWTPQINKFSHNHCVVIDCCSARSAAERELSKIHRERFGLPDLYGDEIPVIGNPDKRVSEYLKKQGVKLLSITAEQYDRNNAIVGIAHFLGIALDMSLDTSQRSLLQKSRAGSFLLQLIEHLKSNSPTTYRETQLLNPYTSNARKRLIENLKDVDRELNNGLFKFEAYPSDGW